MGEEGSRGREERGRKGVGEREGGRGWERGREGGGGREGGREGVGGREEGGGREGGGEGGEGVGGFNVILCPGCTSLCVGFPRNQFPAPDW